MAPSFIKDLRRKKSKSKSSPRTGSTDTSSNGSNGSNEITAIAAGICRSSPRTGSTDTSSNGSNGSNEITATKSNSTINSVLGSTTPPFMQKSSSFANLQQTSSGPIPLPVRPPYTANGSSTRDSVSGMTGLGSPSLNTSLPTSQYAPKIISVSDGSWVYQKVLSVYGTIGDPTLQATEGTLTVSRTDDGFPPISWPVSDSHFKALLYLTPGPNKLKFDFTCPKLANSGSSNNIHSTTITLHMLPVSNSPPLQLVILLGKDSPAEFDSTPARISKEGNGLETAIRKFRMAAYLWQAFTAEQMWRNKMGRRVFRFEEEWQTGTTSFRDRETGTMRNEAKIHVIRSEKTVAEIRDLDIAQQNPNAKRKGDLFGIASNAVKDYFKPMPGQKQYVTVLFLDAHWDKQAKIITGHAALGGGGGEIQLAIFGSQAMHSYPTSLEEVVPAFSDCTRTDTDFVANDCNESGSSWEAANIGIGAHMHEVGHLFGCPHQENGVMLRDYVRLNRSFTTREPFSTRTGEKGGLVLQQDECTWHRLDCLRFRKHPSFRLPTDPPLNQDGSIQVWPVDNGNVLVTAATGVAFIEIYIDGDDLCHHWIEYGDGNGNGPVQRQVVLTDVDLRSRIPEDKRKLSKLKLKAFSFGLGEHEIADFSQLLSKNSILKLPNGQIGFKGSQLGFSQMEGSKPQQLIMESAMTSKVLHSVTVYHGFALDGVEFKYNDGSTQLFGKTGGKAGGDRFDLDVRRGEYISGFYLRAGLWIDGIEILTSLGRRSGVFGNPIGGSGHTLIPPRGYNIVGISGSCAAWIDGFSIIITR